MNPRFTLVSYNKDTIEQFNSDNLADILDCVKSEQISWLTINGYNATNRAEIEEILNFFGVETKLIEDILDQTLLEFDGEHPDCLYLEYAFYQPLPQQDDMIKVHGSLVLGHQFLLLFDEYNSQFFDTIRQKILNSYSRAQSFGPDYLLYLLIRAVVSNVEHILFTELVQKFEALEDIVIASSGEDDMLDEILALRERVKPLYTSVRRLADLIEFIQAEESAFITPNAQQYFNNNLNNDLETAWQGYLRLRNWTTELLDIHRANVGERTNRIIHILTIISTIFLPVTFLTSLYGMNFDNMPELHSPYGYQFLLLLMILIVIIMFTIMKRKKWF